MRGWGDLVFLFLNRTVIFQKHILKFKKYSESNRLSLQNLYLLMSTFLLMQYPAEWLFAGPTPSGYLLAPRRVVARLAKIR